MISSRIYISLAMCNTVRSASNSTSLLVVLNSNLNAYVYSLPSRLTTIRPAPELSELEAPSVNSFHAFSGFGSFLLTSLFFPSYTGASVSFSNSGYFNLAPCNVWLTKSMGICFFPLSPSVLRSRYLMRLRGTLLEFHPLSVRPSLAMALSILSFSERIYLPPSPIEPSLHSYSFSELS
ncbi:hypothetical protein Tco_1152787 [Tanacetum coccineum]